MTPMPKYIRKMQIQNMNSQIPIQKYMKKHQPKRVQKLGPETYFSLQEMKISNYIIETIPYYYHYFFLRQNYKKVNIQNKEISKTTSKFLLWEEIVERKLGFAEAFQQTRRPISLYLDSLQSLFHSCQILQQHHLVHFNLVADSVIFIEDIPRIQDFSTSFLFTETSMFQDSDYNLNRIKNEIKETTQTKLYLTHRPPSWHLLCFMKEHGIQRISMGLLDSVLDNYIENMMKYNIPNKEELWDEAFWESFRQGWYFSLQSLFSKSEKEIQEEIRRESLRWDLYSLCILYLQLIPFLWLHHPETKENSFIQKGVLFLKKNICEISVLSHSTFQMGLEEWMDSHGYEIGANSKTSSTS